MKRTSDDTFYEIHDMIEERLNVCGYIRTYDAWLMCRDKFHYSTIQHHFKAIMDLMCEQGKATRLGGGLWNIVRPNER